MTTSLPPGRCVRLLMASLDRGECYVLPNIPTSVGCMAALARVTPPWGWKKIINNNNDKQGPCLAPMGGGLNAREAITRLCLGQRGWEGGGGGGGRENAGQSYTARQLATYRLACTCLPNSYLYPWAIYSSPGIYSYIHIWPKQEQAPSLPLTQFIFP